MTYGYESRGLRSEAELALSRLIREELESVRFDKQHYDFRFPRHAKVISSRQLWFIARARTMIQLCAPTCDQRVEGCGESEFA